MGAYLAHAKTDKESVDEINDYMIVGASSMQGWRNSQEDAHNIILNFDTNVSYFAVYDGHGGAEVSTYCAEKLPAYLKALSTYIDGNYEQALKDAFLGFDKTLLDTRVISILKVIASEKNLIQREDSEVVEEEDDDFEDLAELHEEGELPLDQVMEKYKGHPSMSSMKILKENNTDLKSHFPCLRGRRAAAIVADAANKAVLDPDCKPEGSSTSKSAMAMANATTKGQNKSETIAQMTPIDNNSAEKEAETSPPLSPTASYKQAPNGSVSTFSETGLVTCVQNGSESSTVSTKQNNHSDIETNKTIDNSIFDKTDNTTKNSDENYCEFNQNGDSNNANNAGHSSDAESNTDSIETVVAPRKKDDQVLSIDSSSEDDADFDVLQPLKYTDDKDYGEHCEDDYQSENNSDISDDACYEEDEDSDDEYEETNIDNENFCANMIEEPGKDSGCTAVVALLVGRDLYVANAGDSRCVVCRNGTAIEMSLDHKPEDAEEFERIAKAGGRVTLDGRVNGGLNLSRALGDHGYKMNATLPPEEQMISALPDVKKLIITPEDEFMVLACDGIWNYMSSEEVVDYIRTRLKNETKKISQICEELFDTCLAPNTMGDGTGCDNMTAVIIRFKPPIMQLPTKINPAETQDVVLTKSKGAVTDPSARRNTNNNEDENKTGIGNQIENDETRGQKRVAPSDCNDINEASAQDLENECKSDAKRIKIDDINETITNTTNITTDAPNSALPLATGSASSPILDQKSIDEVSSNTKEANSTAAVELTST